MKKFIFAYFTLPLLAFVLCAQPSEGKRRTKKSLDSSKVETCHYVNPKTGKHCEKLIRKGSLYCYRHRPFS